MKLTGNTIFITGGGSGIGRGLAEALHAQGNQVIISGRRKGLLDEVTGANAGMESVELNVEDPASIASVAKQLVERFPKLNVLINNAGIMKADQAGGAMDEAVMTSTIATNLMGPIRMTSALLEHLKRQPEATVIHVTSGLAFVPLAMTSVYSATKAALHSYALSQRFKLKGTSVRVVELAPPYVQTELMGERQRNDPMAMPLKDFIEEAMRLLGTDAEELLVERVSRQRGNPGPREWEFVEQFNGMLEKARPNG